ncbi:MAG: hypothetical protein QOH06_3099 [Acidobacteriota bacterium]|jgi:hypothetical protein|nr:hypothetical protein [Acidobacteriota bacterium]
MKLLKGLLYAVLILGALAAFGWYFVSQLGSGPTDDLAGVMLAPPPDYVIVERGELTPTAAAAELEAQVQRAKSGDVKVGLRFKRGGSEVYWLADVEGDFLEERSAGPGGTRLQTVWKGKIRERLTWARSHGDFTVPGLPPPDRKNLYH